MLLLRSDHIRIRKMARARTIGLVTMTALRNEQIMPPTPRPQRTTYHYHLSTHPVDVHIVATLRARCNGRIHVVQNPVVYRAKGLPRGVRHGDNFTGWLLEVCVAMCIESTAFSES